MGVVCPSEFVPRCLGGDALPQCHSKPPLLQRGGLYSGSLRQHFCPSATVSCHSEISLGQSG